MKQLKSLRLPDYITLVGLFSSVAATFLLLREPAWIVPAYFCILGQLVADYFDGKVARWMKRKVDHAGLPEWWAALKRGGTVLDCVRCPSRRGWEGYPRFWVTIVPGAGGKADCYWPGT